MLKYFGGRFPHLPARILQLQPFSLHNHSNNIYWKKNSIFCFPLLCLLTKASNPFKVLQQIEFYVYCKNKVSLVARHEKNWFPCGALQDKTWDFFQVFFVGEVDELSLQHFIPFNSRECIVLWNWLYISLELLRYCCDIDHLYVLHVV